MRQRAVATVPSAVAESGLEKSAQRLWLPEGTQSPGLRLRLTGKDPPGLVSSRPISAACFSEVLHVSAAYRCQLGPGKLPDSQGFLKLRTGCDASNTETFAEQKSRKRLNVPTAVMKHYDQKTSWGGKG